MTLAATAAEVDVVREERAEIDGVAVVVVPTPYNPPVARRIDGVAAVGVC